MSAAAWVAIRPNLTTVAEAGDWAAVLAEGFTPPAAATEDGELLRAAAELVPTLDWAADPWHALTGQLKEATGRKGRALFMPLRLALTGRDHGPDMAALLPLIEQHEAARRLHAAVN